MFLISKFIRPKRHKVITTFKRIVDQMSVRGYGLAIVHLKDDSYIEITIVEPDINKYYVLMCTLCNVCNLSDEEYSYIKFIQESESDEFEDK